MSVELVAENIYRIPVPLGNTPLKELNAYLIKGKGHNLLIDTGFRRPDCRRALLDGIAEVGASMEETDIFLTHLHSDHSGNALGVISGSNHIYISDTDLAYILDYRLTGKETSYDVEKCRKGGMPEEEINRFFGYDGGGIASSLPDPWRFVGVPDGHVFQIAGYSFRCILTPGHSPGHMCLWDPEREIMFTGDHILFDITPNIVCWYEFEDPLGQYLSSLKKMNDFGVKLALPGHRKGGDIYSRVREIREHHGERLRECIGIVADDPGLTAYELTGRMRWRIRAKGWDDFPISQKYFALGECLSHLAYLTKRQYLERRLVEGIYRYTRKDGRTPVID